MAVFSSQARRYSTAGSTLDRETVEQVRGLPRVAGSNVLRHFEAAVGEMRSPAIAIELDPLARGVFEFKEGTPEEAWTPFERGEAVIISEPLAYRTGLGAGQTIQLTAPGGPIELSIAGVYYDYSSEQGVVFLDRDLYRPPRGEPPFGGCTGRCSGAFRKLGGGAPRRDHRADLGRDRQVRRGDAAVRFAADSREAAERPPDDLPGELH